MLSRPDLAFRAGPWPLLLVAGLAVLCLWLLARTVASVLDVGSRSEAPVAGASSAAQLLEAPRESLAQWHLFGSVFAPVDQRAAAAADAPDTTLELTLSGIYADADDPDAGVAMIADAGGAQAAYRAGATVPGGARVRQILADRVLLVHNGRDEFLRLPRERLPSAQSTPSAHPLATSGSGAANVGNQTAVPGAGSGGTAIAPVAVAGLETVDWGAVQQQFNIDPAELAQQVRVQPVTENGAVVGVRVTGTYAALLAAAGLRPDDIITAVNGVAVTDGARAQQVIAAVARDRRARVTVRREGREETLNVSLQ